MPRDNFKPSDIDKLAKRVAFLCSRPACEVVTIGPNSEESKTSNTGVAAHIYAASPGGPRYDPTMTAAQRSNIKNGIWLCNVCSRLIDNDAASYPAVLLQRWKAQAETKAKSRHGQRHLQQKDVQAQMKMMMGVMPESFQPVAIANVHKATKGALESLDNRFSVETSFIDGKSSYTLNPRETVPFSFKVPAHRAPEWREQLKALIDHGRKATVNAQDVKLEGSDLMAHLFDSTRQGTVELIPIGIDTSILVSLKNISTGEQRDFEAFSGKAYPGAKSFRAEAEALGGVLYLGFEHPLHANVNDNIGLSLGIDSSSWDGRDVRLLPGFQMAYDFFAALSAGQGMVMDVFVRGLKICRASYTPEIADTYVREISNMLDYLRRAKIVADYLDCPITYRSDQRFTAEQHMALAEAVDIIEGKHERQLTSNVEATLTITADNPEILKSKVIGSLQFHSGDPGQTIDVYGTQVQLPPIEITVENVVSKMPRRVKRGDTIKATWKPLPNARCIYRYQQIAHHSPASI